MSEFYDNRGHRHQSKYDMQSANRRYAWEEEQHRNELERNTAAAAAAAQAIADAEQRRNQDDFWQREAEREQRKQEEHERRWREERAAEAAAARHEELVQIEQHKIAVVETTKAEQTRQARLQTDILFVEREETPQRKAYVVRRMQEYDPALVSSIFEWSRPFLESRLHSFIQNQWQVYNKQDGGGKAQEAYLRLQRHQGIFNDKQADRAAAEHKLREIHEAVARSAEERVKAWADAPARRKESAKAESEAEKEASAIHACYASLLTRIGWLQKGCSLLGYTAGALVTITGILSLIRNARHTSFLFVAGVTILLTTLYLHLKVRKQAQHKIAERDSKITIARAGAFARLEQKWEKARTKIREAVPEEERRKLETSTAQFARSESLFRSAQEILRLYTGRHSKELAVAMDLPRQAQAWLQSLWDTQKATVVQELATAVYLDSQTLKAARSAFTTYQERFPSKLRSSPDSLETDDLCDLWPAMHRLISNELYEILKRMRYIAAEESIRAADALAERPLSHKGLHSLDQFVGQPKVIAEIRWMMINMTIWPHTLFHGEEGIGRATLAGTIARSLRRSMRYYDCRKIKNAADLADILSNSEEGDINYLDNASALDEQLLAYIAQAMDTSTLEICIDEGPNARSIRLHLPRMTIFAGSTASEKGDNDAPRSPANAGRIKELKKAFQNYRQFYLNSYSEEEIETIAVFIAGELGIPFTPESLGITSPKPRKPSEVLDLLLLAPRILPAELP